MVRKVIVTILFLVSVSINLLLSYFFIQQHKVVEVVDGDTFQLASGRRVRLMGVDAPEYNRCGGLEAKNVLQNLILNRYVFLTEETQETFGRSLALVYTEKGLINKIVLEDGWGRPDYRKNSQREVLTAAFHAASDNKKGIYSALCRIEAQNTPQSCFIKGNIDKNTYKKYYHLPECKQYNQIVLEKDIGEQCFETEIEANKAGFVKAAGCPNKLIISNTDIVLNIYSDQYIACEQGVHISQINASHSGELYAKSSNITACSETDYSINKNAPRANIYISLIDSIISGSTAWMESNKHCFTSELIDIPNISQVATLVHINVPIKKHPVNTTITECFPITGGNSHEMYIPFKNSPYILFLGGDKQGLKEIVKNLALTSH